MTAEQTIIFGLFGAVIVVLVSGRIRYDLAAFSALVIGVVSGVIPGDEAFSGFGHPAVAIIALVLIVSRGLSNSGAVELAAKRLIDEDRGISAHLTVMTVAGAAFSAVINNVAALALLMPLDIEAAKKVKRAAALSLMPLSFATILGGMITLIGTPPNIVVSQYRRDALGEPFSMFDFTPVGLVVAITGLIFVAGAGWRLLPRREENSDGIAIDESEVSRYVAELRVAEGSKIEGVTLSDLYPTAEQHDINLLGLARRGRRLPGFSRREPIGQGDVIVVEGAPEAIEAFIGNADLDFAGSEAHEGGVTGGALTLMEAIVPDTARIAGDTEFSMRLLTRHGVTLLGVSRRGRRFRERVRHLMIRPGDVLLLLGAPDRLEAATTYLGVLPLEGRRTGVIQRDKAWLAIGVFALAVAAATAGFVGLTVALAATVAVYAGMGLIGGTEVYEAVEWKVIVLLAALIPLGEAFERAGGAQLLAGGLLDVSSDLPAWAVLAMLMLLTMTLSDFLNNVVTCLIAAPVGLEIASALDANPDAFLMGVAVAASCAFLTPIGHKNNTIIMGPGGYHFGDYWRMGLPLEALVLAVSVPAILVFWPL